MKFNMKMIALTAALVGAGSAHADLTAFNTGNGSLALYAFNTSTRAYYIRDLGYTLNSFLPSSVTTLAGDGGVTGDKTPNAGLTLNSGSNTNFADSSFSSWLTGQDTSLVKWAIVAGDSLSSGANGVSRLITSSAGSLSGVTNGQVTNFVSGANAGGLAGLFNPGGLSITGTGAASAFDDNFGLGTGTLASLGQDADLYYFARSSQSGGTANAATASGYSNTTGSAKVNLAANGNFSYTLAGETAAVPLPAAAWLLGAGLMSMGGYIRRRRADVALQA